MLHQDDIATGNGFIAKSSEETLTELQPFTYPEVGICTERELYVRTAGAVGLSRSKGIVEFGNGGAAFFNTYFNLFSIGKWQRYCDLKDIRLVLEGQGRFEVSVFLAPPESSFERIFCDIQTLVPDEPFEIDLSTASALVKGGVLYFELRAFGDARLTGGAWKTAQRPLRTPELMLSITTFRREEAVRQSVVRFENFIASSPHKDHIHLTVVDNGKSADLTPSQYVTPVENENLGGAGGFSRGLLEAKLRGATHCLFMDDDATIHMQTLERTWVFLAYTTDPTTAIVGALAKGNEKWALWENGAIFDSKCYRQHGDRDLRDFQNILHIERKSINFPHNFYGGWWYFAFPLNRVQHMPFPFFVRGDDVSFSLVHDFRMVTLPGVITFQDTDFNNKVTPLTEYLDMRSHLVHHLALRSMDIGRLATLKIVAWFFARTMCICHYETLKALNLAFEDVMAGPDFFARNADMALRRADIAALTDAEKWRPVEGVSPEFTPHLGTGLLKTRLMLLTLNGHLVPFFRMIGARRILSANDRGQLSRIWGAAQVTYLDRQSDSSYTVSHSKVKAWQQSWRMLKNAWKFWRDYQALKHEWQVGYDRLTQEEFWNTTLKLTRI